MNQILEYFYEFATPHGNFFNRKISIDSDFILLISPKMSGASSIIYDYLQKFNSKNYLYFDLNDFRVDIDEIQNSLENFISVNKIKILVIENYDKRVKLPKISQIILTSHMDITIEGFTKKLLYPLDFEEYISIEKRLSPLKVHFANYSNSSTYPEIFLHKFNRVKLYQNRLKAIFNSGVEIEIIKELAKFQSEKISIFQIFNIIKGKQKISKDRFYQFLARLEKEKFIFLVEKYNALKGMKKLYLLDFNLKNKITFKKNFIKRFENILFLELRKREKKIFYSDNIDFLLPDENLIILSIPFSPLELIIKKIEKIIKKDDIDLITNKNKTYKLIVVTMDEKKELKIADTHCQILPFWDFVLNL